MFRGKAGGETIKTIRDVCQSRKELIVVLHSSVPALPQALTAYIILTLNTNKWRPRQQWGELEFVKARLYYRPRLLSS